MPKLYVKTEQHDILARIVSTIEQELFTLKEMIKLGTQEHEVLSQANIVSQGLGYIESYMVAKEFNMLM